MKIPFHCTTILLVLLSAAIASSQTKDRWKQSPWSERELKVTPAKITQNSFKYKLFDDSDPTAQHNSASYYYRACLKWAAMAKSHRAQLYQRGDVWFDGPIADLPQVEIQQWLSKSEPALKELSKALAGSCNWGLKGSTGLTFSEINDIDLSVEYTVLSELARVLRLQSRLHLARKEFKQAVEPLADSIKLSQDIAKLPGILSASASVNIAIHTMSIVNEMAALPDSPNMLRALQTLPNPIGNFRPAIRDQFASMERGFQFLDNPVESNRSEVQWRAVFLDGMAQLDQNSRQIYEEKNPGGWEGLVASRERRLGLLMAKLFPSAKRELITAGWDKEELGAMPVGKVIAIQTRRLWDQHVQLFVGIENLSAAEVCERARQMQSSDLVHGELLGSFPFHTVIIAQEDLLMSRWDDVSIGMNVELLRDHLAKEGSFPEAKQFEKMNPWPDPHTDQPFEYRILDNGNAQLQSSPRDGEGYVRTRYTIKKAKE